MRVGQYGSGIEIDIDGIARVRRALRELEPEALRRLDRELYRAARVVADEAGRTMAARARTHSGESPPAARSYRVQYRRSQTGAVRGLRITTKSRGASIIEFAGRSGAYTPRGRTLVRTLTQRYGRPGRVLWAAWDAHDLEVEARIRDAVAEAERRIQQFVERGAHA